MNQTMNTEINLKKKKKGTQSKVEWITQNPKSPRLCCGSKTRAYQEITAKVEWITQNPKSPRLCWGSKTRANQEITAARQALEWVSSTQLAIHMKDP